MARPRSRRGFLDRRVVWRRGRTVAIRDKHGWAGRRRRRRRRIGLRRLVAEACDMLVSIPMVGQIESLNAAVAGSIALYEAFREPLEA